MWLSLREEFWKVSQSANFIFFAHITTTCASFHYQEKDVHSLSQSDNLSVARNEERNAKKNGKAKASATPFMKFGAIFFQLLFQLGKDF